MLMDFKTSELIKKYWEADTSLQEEEQLKRELLSATNETDWEEEKALFAHFKQAKEAELDDSFDQALLAEIDSRETAGTRQVQWTDYFKQYYKIAAAVVVLLVSGMLYQQQQKEVVVEDTFDNPEVAYAELKKQLLIVSRYLNKGQQTVSELNNLSKVPSELKDFAKMSEASEGLEMLSEMNVEN
ncbi:hypothetical protein GCM10011340_16360 [Roseivirga thermotolerans]|uniref:Anti sigma-E protein RseA N-terminal domain-containing protein n=2 Tax=Roseivirgaceae TaxID=2762306 RepID=A0ABQ3I4H6_9BACT|nr:hypothetical protein GCM10011340_16360 [Roseivirga thermotolerans]